MRAHSVTTLWMSGTGRPKISVDRHQNEVAPMLGSLLGSVNKERVLVYIAGRRKGYAREIARFFDAPLSPVQNALDRLEEAAVLVSRRIGSTREYEFNPRYPARPELEQLLNRAVALYPERFRDALLLVRSRPRRRGKPL
jgi:hypothetical protein